jgi:hypothetical protein
MESIGSVRIAALMAALCGAISGCAQPAPTMAEVTSEQSLAEQIAAVKRGETTRILVDRDVLADRDLLPLVDLTELTDLLLDNSESEFTVQGLAGLTLLPNLQHLRIRGRGVNDAALQAIAKIKRLRILNVPHGRFSNDGLQSLAAAPDLEQFRFGSPYVTDDGMNIIAGWPAIRSLHLIDVPITDAGLAELAEIERLQSLYIDGGQISDAGWEALFRERPRLHVHVNQQHHDRDPNRHPH